MKTGLVLEGGGMRGFYTLGVLDAFMDSGINFDYVVGVSAGAAHALTYLSGQHGRGLRVTLKYVADPRYLSFRNLIKEKSAFGMDFIFNVLPHGDDPFDYEAFNASKAEYYAGATNIETGQVRYFSKDEMGEFFLPVQASSSLPLISVPVEINGKKYMDGGIGDPIPIGRALLDGCDKIVVVLTRPRTYEKAPESFKGAYTRLYKKYPAFVDTINRRHLVYKAEQKQTAELEKNGKAVVIAPAEGKMNIGRFEKNHDKLRALYDHGYDCTMAQIDKINALFTE